MELVLSDLDSLRNACEPSCKAVKVSDLNVAQFDTAPTSVSDASFRLSFIGPPFPMDEAISFLHQRFGLLKRPAKIWLRTGAAQIQHAQNELPERVET